MTEDEVEVDIRVEDAVTPGGMTGGGGELVGRGWG